MRLTLDSSGPWHHHCTFFFGNRDRDTLDGWRSSRIHRARNTIPTPRTALRLRRSLMNRDLQVIKWALRVVSMRATKSASGLCPRRSGLHRSRYRRTDLSDRSCYINRRQWMHGWIASVPSAVLSSMFIWVQCAIPSIIRFITLCQDFRPLRVRCQLDFQCALVWYRSQPLKGFNNPVSCKTNLTVDSTTVLVSLTIASICTFAGAACSRSKFPRHGRAHQRPYCWL